MTASFDPMMRIPVTRATFYEHEDVLVEGRAGIAPLDITNLGVDIGVTDGRVTLSGSVNDRISDAYGVEFDLAPAAARLLAAQLMAAAGSLPSSD